MASRSTPVDPPEAESRCERCGISCHASILVDGRNVVIEGLHCIFLKMRNGEWACSVYDQRFEKAPWCLHSTAAIPAGALRADCPYGRNPGGKVRLSSKEYAVLWPQIKAAIEATGVINPNFTWEKFNRFAGRRDPGYRWVVRRSILGQSGTVHREKTSWKRFKDWWGRA